MGVLQLAGVVSGAGEGMGRGLQQLNSGIIQQGLQESSQQFAAEKLKLQMEHAERLQALDTASRKEEGAATRAQALALHQDTEAGADRRNKATQEGENARQQVATGGAIVGKGMDAESEREKQRSMDARQLLELNKDIQVARIQASKSTELKLSPAVKARIDFQMKQLDGVQEILKPGSLTTPEQMDQAKKQIAEIGKAIDRLVDVDVPEEEGPKPINPGGFGKHLQGTGPKTPAESPAAPMPAAVVTPEPTVAEPSRPTTNYRGKADPEKLKTVRAQQLEFDVAAKRKELEQAKVHSNKARVKNLEEQLAQLEAQQEAAKGLINLADKP